MRNFFPILHNIMNIPSDLHARCLSVALMVGILATSGFGADVGEWRSLFDGRTLDGWKASESSATFSVRDGAIVVHGRRAHLYYDGPIANHDFRNFELSLEVKTFLSANSGVYFHTQFQETGWPAKGYEVQVNTSHSDPDRTGGLWGVKSNPIALAKDGEWATLIIRVEGKHITTHVNGQLAADYIQEDTPIRKPSLAGRLVGSGTFALQGHDPASEVHYRNIKVRRLP
jgi:hypothetical protein